MWQVFKELTFLHSENRVWRMPAGIPTWRLARWATSQCFYILLLYAHSGGTYVIICICNRICLFYMAALISKSQPLPCAIKLEVILSLKVIASFFSYNTKRSNLEELLQISREKVASGFTDEIKDTSCLQNKLHELQVSLHLLKTYLVPKLLFFHVEPSPSMCYVCCQGVRSILTTRFIRSRGKWRVQHLAELNCNLALEFYQYCWKKKLVAISSWSADWNGSNGKNNCRKQLCCQWEWEVMDKTQGWRSFQSWTIKCRWCICRMKLFQDL